VSETVDDAAASGFEANRGRLFGLAYRMLGSRAEAEDVVQDAYLRWHQSDRNAIRNPQAWLVSAATRLAIDRLRALKTERDAYTGPWLPEPMTRDTAPPPDRHAELASDLSIAFMVLLERLGPEERAAFLLHEVFDFDYSEIAAVLEKSEDACRQIVHRARTRVKSARKRFEVTEAAKANLLRKFTRAVGARDEKTLIELFAPDATWTADGGGRAAASRHPIVGAEQIARLVLALREHLQSDRATMELIEVNGETGLCVRTNGRVTAVMSILSDGDRIHAVYAIVNPDKLAGSDIRTTRVAPSAAKSTDTDR
jgi:RNA polymerase sigma-70 factor (ECF subfamily)